MISLKSHFATVMKAFTKSQNRISYDIHSLKTIDSRHQTIQSNFQNDYQDKFHYNENASRTCAEYERTACEEELYRLRYGIENLLANKESDTCQVRRWSDFYHRRTPMQTMADNVIEFCSKCIVHQFTTVTIET
jgi:hypothetical protein